jgi:hypothetical protein
MNAAPVTRRCKRPPAHPPEPGYPCCVSALGELAWMAPRGEPSSILLAHEDAGALATGPSRSRKQDDTPQRHREQDGQTRRASQCLRSGRVEAAHRRVGCRVRFHEVARVLERLRPWRIRLVAYGARLESVLGESPRGFESPILRHRGPGPAGHHPAGPVPVPGSFGRRHPFVSSLMPNSAPARGPA